MGGNGFLVTSNPSARIDEFSEFKELNCSYLPLKHLIVVDKEKKKEKKKEIRYSKMLSFGKSEHHYILILDLSKSNLRGCRMDPPHSKITQTFAIYFSFLGFCYSEVVFCFVSS